MKKILSFLFLALIIAILTGQTLSKSNKVTSYIKIDSSNSDYIVSDTKGVSQIDHIDTD